jgi:hypothetical protein
MHDGISGYGKRLIARVRFATHSHCAMGPPRLRAFESLTSNAMTVYG